MTISDAVTLGILQGVTEFLPISSSGHLVVAQSLMGISESGILFEIAVHLGTLGSILLVFNQDIKKMIATVNSSETRKLIGYLFLATLPIAIIGSAFRSDIEKAFDNPTLVAIAFLVTGIVLISTRFSKKRQGSITGGQSVIVGFSQAVALLPGISRTGMTISSALLLGIDPAESARFSFLLAIPALLGSGVMLVHDFLLSNSGVDSPLPLVVGFFTAFSIGVLALKWLLGTLTKGKFHWFGLYCLMIGIFTMGL